MPSIEGSFGVAYGKGPYGWDSEEVAACKLAAGVLNALESYFWVSLFTSLQIAKLICCDHRNTSEVPDLLTEPRSISTRSMAW
jgi:hypothetical protein